MASAYAADEICTAWGEASSVTVEEVGNGESSGLVAWDDYLFTMDDAAGATLLYAIRTDGSYVGAQEVGGATNTDWEDLGLGPCPAAVDATTCLFVADIGDNDENRASLTLWVYPAGTDQKVEATACELVYEDGPRDAETLLVSADGAVRVVSKEGDGEAKIYRVDVLECGEEPDTLVREAEIQLDGAATGGAVRADGAQLAIRSASTAWIWGACALDWAAPLTSVALPASGQGEAIALGAGGELILSTEGEPLVIDTLPCEATEACERCGCAGVGRAGWGGWLLSAGVIVAGRRRRSTMVFRSRTRTALQGGGIASARRPSPGRQTP